MADKIIYSTGSGGIGIITPAPGKVTMDVALRDVPTGRPFKIVDEADVPSDRTARNQWAANDADLTDGVGA